MEGLHEWFKAYLNVMLQALLPFIDKRECMMVVFEKLLLSEQEYCTQKKSIGVRKLWNCYWKYYLRKIDMIWKRCYIVGIPQSFLLIPSIVLLAHLLPSLLLAFFEVIFIFSFLHFSECSPYVRKTEDKSS